MATKAKAAKKAAARGKPGAALSKLKKYVGQWTAEGVGPMGSYRCDRIFEEVRGGKWLRLTVIWDLPSHGMKYEEVAVYGVDPVGKRLRFWSFTSDGKRSEGEFATPADVPPDALCFEADVSGRRARMIWSPVGPDGFTVAVEASLKKGWRRFLEQRFRAA
jgi:hypothetical protein